MGKRTRVCGAGDCGRPASRSGWCSEHSLEGRFWSKTDKRGPDECWPWIGYRDPHGYGIIAVKQPDGKWPHRFAFRLSYEFAYGPIPEGFQVDHTCHNGDLACPGGNDCYHRPCVNPAHLEAVTRKENANRSHCTPSAKTHCPHGHEYTPDNVYKGHNGNRLCRTCTIERMRAHTRDLWDQGLTAEGLPRKVMKPQALRYLIGGEMNGLSRTKLAPVVIPDGEDKPGETGT